MTRNSPWWSRSCRNMKFLGQWWDWCWWGHLLSTVHLAVLAVKATMSRAAWRVLTHLPLAGRGSLLAMQPELYIWPVNGLTTWSIHSLLESASLCFYCLQLGILTVIGWIYTPHVSRWVTLTRVCNEQLCLQHLCSQLLNDKNGPYFSAVMMIKQDNNTSI